MNIGKIAPLKRVMNKSKIAPLVMNLIYFFQYFDTVYIDESTVNIRLNTIFIFSSLNHLFFFAITPLPGVRVRGRILQAYTFVYGCFSG